MKHTPGEIPYVYIYVYLKLKDRIKFSEFIEPKNLLEIMRRIIRVPKILHYPILAQMEEHGLIKRINHQKYQILASDCDKVLDKLRNFAFW